MAEEKRETQRQKTLKGALIAFNDGHSTVSCTISNFSSGGARLKVASILGVPDTFTLRLADKRQIPCTVVWRKATELGVRFDAI
jgi:hypothetical protein